MRAKKAIIRKICPVERKASDDIYSEESLDAMNENGQISPEEQGFMLGYLQSI